MPSVFEIADRYVEQTASLDPIFATHLGVPGADHALTDFSPEGLTARNRLDRQFLSAMDQIQPQSDHDRIAREVFLERLGQAVSRFDAKEGLRHLEVTWSPMQLIRSVFDLMPRDSSDHWRLIAKRMGAVPEALDGVVASLREGQRQGLSAARRQALACARQAEVWSGADAGVAGFFGALADEYVGRAGAHRKVEESLRKSADAADRAYGDLAHFLRQEYAPAAPEADGVGAERYGRAVRWFLGADIDLAEAYQWGWAELKRIRVDIADVCHQLSPGATFPGTVDRLNGEYDRAIQGEPALRDWLHAFMARTITELNGKHFDIPEALQRLEVRIAPCGAGPAHHYVGPSEDFTRPGTYWYATTGKRHFPLWNEISTAYHEGVPGHHLQLGYWQCSVDRLSRFQRNLSVSGQTEGWASYAEALMDELGYLDRPEYRLDMLAKALFRAAGVVVDIGMHLGLTIPDDEPFHPGETWDADLGLAFLAENSSAPESVLRSEIDRYLGAPAQAISYKLGERLWVQARHEAQQRAGDSFDLKHFHMAALGLGPMGLDQLKAELARL